MLFESRLYDWLGPGSRHDVMMREFQRDLREEKFRQRVHALPGAALAQFPHEQVANWPQVIWDALGLPGLGRPRADAPPRQQGAEPDLQAVAPPAIGSSLSTRGLPIHRVLLSYARKAAQVRVFRGERFPRGLRFRVTSALRTAAEQDALFRQGRTRLPAGKSLHESGLAVDIVSTARTSQILATQGLQMLASRFGLQAVLEADHLHLELDMQGSRAPVQERIERQVRRLPPIPPPVSSFGPTVFRLDAPTTTAVTRTLPSGETITYDAP